MARGFPHEAKGTGPAATPGRTRMPARGMLLVPALLGATAAPALTPLPPCEGTEAGMRTGSLIAPEGTGLTFERYNVNIVSHGDLAEADAPPVPELGGFSGVRVTHCASGQMVAIAGEYSSEKAAAALGATEFLRKEVQAGRRISAGKMKQAAKAVYGQVLVLRETEETCGCNSYFPELRPKGMTPFDRRRDVGQ